LAIISVGGHQIDRGRSVHSQIYGGLSAVLRLFAFLSIVLGVLFLVRVILLFFGALQTAPGYEAFISFTGLLVDPLQVLETIETPYGGQFDITATGLLLIVLVIEFLLVAVQDYLGAKRDGPGEKSSEPA
jgi:hypothetical protein